MTAIQPFHVMTKPNGPRCNLDCAYCYYLEKERLYPDERKFRMRDDVLETYIRDYMAACVKAGLPEIWFTWQGGEPTMLGVDYFRRIVALQEKHRPPGRRIKNALQTNGTLINAEWAAFFKDNGFLIGVSIDGPKDLHDRFRVDRRQAPTFDRVMAGFELLRGSGVDVNVLTVVHRHNAYKPREVYRFLKSAGVEFMQFIPLVERSVDGGVTLSGVPHGTRLDSEIPVTSWSVRPEAYGDFLCEIFDEWIEEDVGRIFVQLFDVQLGLWMGGPSALCVFAETCGEGLALEHDGSLYSCDHYVYPEYRLGNITETPLDLLAASPRQRLFGDAKRDELPDYCRRCAYRFACHGGCPKHRFLMTPDGEPGLNYFCASNRRFFAHAGESLRIMAELVRRGEPAARIMDLNRRRRSRIASAGGAPGRNDPCPCGSGRKFKKCCGQGRGA